MVPQARDLQSYDTALRNNNNIQSSNPSLNPVSSADRFVGNTLNVAASEGTAFVEEKEMRKSSGGGGNKQSDMNYLSRTLESN